MPRRKSTQFSPLKRPLDGEFSYDSLGKKNKNYSDSTDSIESISASSRKDSGSTSPWNQPVNLESDAGIQKVDSKKSCPKGTKSASLPSIVHIPEDASDQQSGSEASGQGSSSSEKRNLSLEYLFQVTDSELQNMSREIPNSQNVTVANNAIRASTSQAATQLILAPVASHQPGEDNFMVQEVVKLPVSEKGVEKYQLKSDTLEQQGLKLVYTKQTYDQYEPNPVSYGAYKPQAFKSHQQVVDKIIQQAAGEVTVGRKRKHPQKPGRHICQYCGRGCAKPSVLQKHIRAHTGERPYPCEACGFSFKTKSNLYKHCKSRAHALKAGLSQNLGVSSEVGGTEGDGENDDVNEDSEDSLETLSDTDGQEEEEIKDSALQQPETFLLAANEEKLSRESEDVAWVKKSSSLNDGLTDYGSAEHAFVDNVTCRIVAQTSKGQIAELRNFSAESTLQETLVQESKSKVLVPAVTAHTTVYLTDKHFYDVAPIPKHPSPKVSLTGWPREESLSHVSVSEVLHLTQQPNCDQATKALQSLETIQGKLASVANEELPLATSVQTLPDKSVQVTIQLPRVSTQGKENDMESKSLMLHSPAVTSSVLSRVTGAESKLLSSEMLRERIQQLISANAAIVDTPMAEPPRPKRIMRQNSEATISIQSVRMECSTQSTTLPSPRVSIPSISSVPLTPIPDDIEGRTNTDSYLHSSSIDKSEKPSADSIKPSPPHVEEAAVDITKTLIDAGFPDEKLPPSSVPSVTESIRPEIKIQIKLPKVSTMSVVPPSVVSQSMIGQPSVQFPLTSTQKCSLAACLKTTEGSVIKGLLLKEKAQSLNLPSTCHEGATLEKSYSSDSALKMEPTPTLVKDTHTSYLCSNCNILFKEERTFQMHQLYNCKRTETDFLFSSTPTRESKLNLSNPSRLGSIQKDIIATYLSQNQVLGNLANKPCSAELENIEKSFEEKSSLPAVAENPDSSTQKKKGRPKGTKNKLKDYAEPPSTTAPIHVLSCMSPSLSVPQTPILLATLQKKPILLPQGTLLASPVASASMIGQPMVSVQSPWSQPNTSTHSPVSVSITPQTPQTPTSEVPTTQSLWKLKLKGKLLMKRSMSVERMLSREKESEASSPLGPLGTISSVAPVADGLGLGPKTIPLDGSKLADDNIERNDRNSPLKKRKVPSEFLQLDPVLRPGVTRAGSEPLMTSLSHRHRDLSLPNVSEISKSSLTEIYNLSQAGNNANSVGPPGSCREPVTVPVAQPLALPTQFGTPIQSFLCSFGIGVRQQMGIMPFSIPHGLSSLPAIIANSSLITTETDVLQLPLVTSLVVSQSQKVGKSGQMQILKQLNSPSKTDKTGTSSSVITQPLNRLMNSKPAPDKNLTPLYLYRHSYPSLQSLTHVTFCCVQPLQPMYVPQGGNAKISMYSNWRVSPHNRNPVGLTSRALFSLYNSRYTSNPVYISANSTPPREGIFTHSSYWNYYSSKPKIPVSTSSHDKQAEGLWQAATSAANTTTKVVKLPTDTRVSAEEKDVSQAVVAPADSESTQAMPRLKEFFSGKEPKRVRIFKGGFKSNEEYVYVKGRGRGKYVCEKCGIRCKKPSMLKKHIRTHTDLRPYHCRHCRFSFKTKGNLTKHMKSKAHQKKCLELGVNPVPVTVDDSQIDNEALAAQCAIAKDTKILEDENEMDDDEDDEDMDEEEETDDAEEGQYSDSEDSERKIAISYEKMDTAESTVEKGSEADPSVRPVFANTSPTECPQAHPAKSRAVSLELIPAKGSSGPLPSSRVASVPDVHATSTTSPTRQTAHQLQIDKEIAKSLLDLSKHPEHRMENLDRTTVTESSRRGSLLLRQNSIDFGLSGPPGLTGKEDQESSGSQASPPAHDANESRVAEIPAEKEGRRDEFVLNKSAAPLLLEKLGMKIGISHLNRSIASTPSSFGTVSVGSQKSSIMADSVKETPKPTEERNLQTILSFPVPPAKASLPPSSSPPQSHPSGLMSSCYHGPIIGQLIRRESINVQSVSSNVSSQLGVATTSFATPFQFSHPFQAFERTSNMAGEQEDLTLTMARDNKLATENDVVIIGTSTTISSDRREMLNSAVVNSHDIMSTIGKVPGDETLQVVLSRVGSLPLSNRLGKSGELDAGKSTQTTSPILQKMHRVVIPSQQYRVSSYEGWHAAGEPTPGTADAVLSESNTDGQYKCNVCFKKICEHQQHLLCQQESFSEESGCFCCDVCNLTFRSELQKMEHLLSDPPHSQVVAKDPVRMAAEDVQASHDCQGCKCSFWKKSRLMKRGESSSQGTALHNFQKFSADVHPQAERKSPADWEKHPETTHLQIGFRQGVEEALDLSVEDTAVAATGEEESDEGELMIDENDVEQDMDVTSPDSADRSLKEHFHVHQKAAYERNKEASNERVTVEIKQEPIDIGEIGHGKARSSKWYAVDSDSEKYGNMEADALASNVYANNVSVPMGLMEKAHKCGICRKAYQTLEQLKTHLIAHAELRPYVCEYCDAGFTNAQSLKTHLQTHRQEKPYVCGNCGDTFARSEDLKRHLHIHSAHMQVLRYSLDETFQKRRRADPDSPSALRGGAALRLWRSADSAGKSALDNPGNFQAGQSPAKSSVGHRGTGLSQPTKDSLHFHTDSPSTSKRTSGHITSAFNE